MTTLTVTATVANGSLSFSFPAPVDGVAPASADVIAALANNSAFVTAVEGGAPVPTPTPAPAGKFGVAVSGKNLINTATGNTVQLRGTNVSGLESVAIQGWSAGDPFGGMAPNLASVKAWNINTIRLPLNSASWLGMTTFDTSGATRNADPGSNYQATVLSQVQAMTAAGFFVILDLHWSAPNLNIAGRASVPLSPLGQAPMADASYAIAFWTQVANMFKGYPNVMFDLFNEPYIDRLPNVSNAWQVLRDGGTLTQFPDNTTGSTVNLNQNLTSAGMQAMLNAVRGTGATNVILSAGLAYSADESQWVAYAPVDPLKQLACSVHWYPTWNTTPGTTAYNTLDTNVTAQILAVQAAGFPVVLGEIGGHCANGSPPDGFTQNVLAFIDANALSVCAWTWNFWGQTDNDLIKDATGTPTDGFGVVYKAWTTSKPTLY